MNKKEEYEEKVKSMGFDSVADYRRYLMYASDEEFMKYVSARKNAINGNEETQDDGWDSLDSVGDTGSIKGSDKIRDDFWDSMDLASGTEELQRFKNWSGGNGKSATFNEECSKLLKSYCRSDVLDGMTGDTSEDTLEDLFDLLQTRVNQYGKYHDKEDLFWYTMKRVGRMFSGEPVATSNIIKVMHEESLVNKRPMEAIAKFEQVSREQLSKIGCIEEQEIKLPERATVGSAGYDFFAPKDYTVAEGETVVIPTGVRCCMEPGWVLSLYPRSGMGFKYLVGLANTVGIIDSDYYYSDNEGHIMVKLVNRGIEPLEIKKGKAFCQGIFTKYGVTIDDNAKDIRNGGFNSTNK